MTISFNSVPFGTRSPAVYTEVDPSNAQQGPSIVPTLMLVIAQRLATGTVAELVPTLVSSYEQGQLFFGRGSMMAETLRAIFNNNPRTQVWAVAQDDAGGSVAATATLTVTGTATEARTFYVYVAGKRFAVPVADTDDANAVAAAIEAAIDAGDADLPATCSSSTNVATLTARNKGEVGNELDVQLNYNQGESLPAGITIAVSNFKDEDTGATNPDVTDVWPVLGSETWYNRWVVPYTDATNLAALNTELAARFDPVQQKEAVAFLQKNDTLANLVTFGDALNSPHYSINGALDSPSPPYEWAGAIAAVVTRHGKIDPARPFQTLRLVGILPPVESKRFDLGERDQLLADGVATYKVAAGGEVVIDRLVTTYQENAAGADDTAYLDVNTMLTLEFIRYDMRNQTLLKYPRHKLMKDGTKRPVGQAILTPNLYKAFVISLWQGWADLGLVEGIEAFKEALIAEINAQDPNRLDVSLAPDLVNQLRILGVKIAFLL